MKAKKLFIFLFFLPFLIFLTSCDEAQKVYKVKFVDFNNTVLSTQEVEAGLAATAPNEPTRIGYTFEKWDVEFTNIQSDITVKAIYKANLYEIKFIENGGSDVDDILIEFDKPIELPIPTLKGYNFDGWYMNENLTNRFNNWRTVPVDGVTLYAGWQKIEYIITLNSNGGNGVGPIIAYYDEIVEELPVPVKSEFSFVGWKLNDQFITAPFTYNFEENIRLKAEWKSIYDLGGYTIRIVESKNTYDPYSNYYIGYDKEARKKAWEAVEEKFNCRIEAVPYPDYAEWGTPRWNYIQEQANGAEYDFYVVPDSEISRFANSNAIRDITDWYTQHGKGYMDSIYKTSGSVKGKLYSITDKRPEISNVMYYNINLLETLGFEKSPAQLFLDGEWTYSKFKEYAILAQSKFNALDSIYYAVSGCSPCYWVGMANAGGLNLASTSPLEVNILDQISIDVANTLREIKEANAMSPKKEVDAGITSWMQGHALFATGDLWFVKTANRWPANLWGDDTKYGFVPFPRPDGTPLSSQKIGIPGTETLVMSTGKSYEGYGETCTPQNVYKAIAETFIKTKEFLEKEGVTYLDELNKKPFRYADSEDSFQAFYYIASRIQEIGFFEPLSNPDNNIASPTYGDFSNAINNFVMGNIPSFEDGIRPFIDQLKRNLFIYY